MDTEKLRKLHQLKEEGILSESEFQQEKQKLLNEEQAAARSTQLVETNDLNQYAMFMHLSLLLGLVFPWVGFIVPIVLWLMKKENSYINQQGRIVVNWLISSLIYSAIGMVLLLVLIGIAVLAAVAICTVVFAIVGAMKAREGEVWAYPLSIKFFKVDTL
ncbi:DUF4870 domain-containing protein [Aliidiomarina celeris]|uniref:DUF4870 domain-containing protein n=1 Tax=Aliidiomarina celeris TaxID=2249428 RepID=UPI000DE912D0|nr:DUF4870 domain-containing protein [Aliidiomarina celeris]